MLHKLTEAQRTEIVRRMYHGETGYQLGKEYGVRGEGLYKLFERRVGKGIYHIRKHKPSRRLPPQKVDVPYYIQHYKAKLELLDDELCMLVIE